MMELGVYENDGKQGGNTSLLLQVRSQSQSQLSILCFLKHKFASQVFLVLSRVRREGFV